MEIFFRVSFHWDLFQFINGLLLGNLNARPQLGILHPTNSLSCEKSSSFQSSQPTWKSFLSLARTSCSVSIPPVSKRSSTKRFMILVTDFPVAGIPSMGSHIFSNAASLSVISHAIQVRCHLCRALVWSTFCSNFVHMCGLSTTLSTSVSSCGNHAIATQCLVRNVPTASRSIISCHKQVSLDLQRYKEDDLLLVELDTQHHGSHHKTVLDRKLS